MSTRKPNQSVRLTKTVVEKLPAPATGQAFVRDRNLKGFAVRVTAAGVKSFIVEKRIAGKVRRMTLGRFGELTAEEARKEAHKLLGRIATGRNPIAEREHARLQRTTLADTFADFRKARKALKAKTLYDYERILAVAFSDWQKQSLLTITHEHVAKRHARLGTEHGEAYANLAMRVLRALFNFAIAHYEDGFGRPLLTDNPVLRLTRTRAWYRERRRQTVIPAYALPEWHRGVVALRAQGEPTSFAATVADYLLFLLLTGLRRGEAARLAWPQVDLRAKTVTIPDPKNRQPFTLPVSDFVAELLERRFKQAEESEEVESAYVFPGQGRREGYLIEPKHYVARLVASSGVPFTLHDLRRTFVTTAEALDIAPYTIKRLVNHKAHGDVTAGYIVSDVERLRGPTQRITDFLLAAMGVAETASVVPPRSASQTTEGPASTGHTVH